MDPQHIATFSRVRTSEYLTVEENCQKLNKYIADYEAVKSSLTSLSEKCKHPVMVPFGSVAFMSGSLVHTNDVLVLLGDNWFVEQSAKQTADILDRRIAALQTQVDKLRTRMQQIETELSYAKGLAKESSDTIEIVEPYDEQVEQTWRAQHEASVRKCRQETKVSNDQSNIRDEARTEYEQILQRLEQLEKEEEAEDEEKSCKNAGETYSPAAAAQGEPLRDTVVGTENLTERSHALVINFKHSASGFKVRERCANICSPADVYDKYCVPPSSATAAANLDHSQVMQNSSSETADSELHGGSDVDASQCADEQRSSVAMDMPSSVSEPPIRKVSKFKASRLKK